MASSRPASSMPTTWRRSRRRSGYAETTVLLTKEATSGRLIKEMLRLARALEAGDLLFLTYSGHGGQMPAEGERRGRQAWTRPGVSTSGQLIDNETLQPPRPFKQGVRIVSLSDSCHSGTVLRDRHGPVGLAQRSWPEHRQALPPRPCRGPVPPEEDARPGGTDRGDDGQLQREQGHLLALQAATAGAESTGTCRRRDPDLGLPGRSGLARRRHNGLFTAN